MGRKRTLAEYPHWAAGGTIARLPFYRGPSGTSLIPSIQIIATSARVAAGCTLGKAARSMQTACNNNIAGVRSREGMTIMRQSWLYSGPFAVLLLMTAGGI